MASALLFGPLSACGTAIVSCFASMGFSACKSAGGAATMVSARLAYVLLFLCGQIVSWLLRDFAEPLLKKITPWIVKESVGIKAPPKQWFGYQAVRLARSLACWLRAPPTLRRRRVAADVSLPCRCCGCL